jgi:putative phosphonate metabolism protein
MAPRYALYFVPRPDTALARIGAGVIGYDIWSGASLPQVDLGLDPTLVREASVEPRRYGFHATLKAPFYLRDGASLAALEAQAAAFAARQAPVPLGRIEVRALSRFCAMVPASPPLALTRLAADCVQAFDTFRAPLGEADRARRLEAPLTPRQKAYLDAWGYPYVLDEFRFHMTLTGPLEAHHRLAFQDALAALWAGHDEPVAIEGLALVVQPTREARFRVATYLPFTGPPAT